MYRHITAANGEETKKINFCFPLLMEFRGDGLSSMPQIFFQVFFLFPPFILFPIHTVLFRFVPMLIATFALLRFLRMTFGIVFGCMDMDTGKSPRDLGFTLQRYLAGEYVALSNNFDEYIVLS